LAAAVGPIASAVRAQTSVFRAESRLVEIYATVSDEKGRLRAGLDAGQFEVLENGKAQELVAFEAETASAAIAILLDTTGSMQDALPTVKRFVNDFIDRTGPSDHVAVFSFAETVRELQEFTRDKAEAKRAVLRTKAGGVTALFDAITQVLASISGRQGKKALVVFTDGQDTASALTASAAVNRARNTGIPVFSVAAGDALKSRNLVRLLENISEATGGTSYTTGNTNKVGELFVNISGQLRHMYMLAYVPPAEGGTAWRSVQVNVRGAPKFTVRARQGYFAN
jgi:Ca-activated chloride channel family protein